MRENRIIIALMTVIVVAGALLRFWSLGAQQLTAHEMPYHFAARSVAQGSGSQLPSGAAMTRGVPMIHVIASLQGSLRAPETSARLPSAILGTVALMLFAGFVWLVAGPWSALVATFLFAFYPEAIRQSRLAGLYSFQQLCGVIALAAGWLATSQSAPQQKSSPLDLVRRWIWVAVTGAAFAAAGLAHLSAGTVLSGFAVWVLALAAVAVWVGGKRVILWNVAAQLVLLGVLGGVAIFVLKPDILSAIFDKISSVPDAAATASGSPGFYLQAYGSQFGWVFTLLPLIALVAFRKYTWLSIYLLLWFLVPLVEHSLFIARKEERLLLMAAPALFMLSGLAVAEGREILMRAINVQAREWLASYRSAVLAANQVASFVVIFALITLPAVIIAFHTPTESSGGASRSEWSALRRALDTAPNSQGIPFGSADPMRALLYLGRADFGIGANLTELSPAVARTPATGRFRPVGDSLTVESQSGAVLVKNLKGIRDAYLPYGDVHVAMDSRDVGVAVVERSIRTALEQNAAELCRGRCGSLRLYRMSLADLQIPQTPPPL